MYFFIAGCAQVSTPSGCSAITPPAKRDAAFVHWVIAHEMDFKQHSCWEKHVALGLEAIQVALSLNDESAVMQLSIQLASTQFYQGHFDQCLQLAENAKSIAEKRRDRKAQVQSLYLISAAQRVANNPLAVKTAAHALLLSQQYLPNDDGLKAKVLYNLAAAEMDVEPPALDAALTHFKEADQRFAKLGHDYDRLRVKRRIADIYFIKEQYGDAERLLIEIESSLKNPREQMINAYQLAKTQHKLGQWQQSVLNIDKAYTLASELQATADLERIRPLRLLIHSQSPS